MELLSDVATAVRNVLAQIAPSLPVDIVLSSQPQPELRITVKQDADSIYPRFIKLGKRDVRPLRPTEAYRRLLGLPAEEE